MTAQTDNDKQGKQDLDLWRQQAIESAELSSISVSAAAKAEVEAAWKMALMAPRSEDDARARILMACRHPGFAAKAKYRKPVGKNKDERTGEWTQNYVIGPSIRFVEQVLISWRNVLTQQTTVYDDREKRVVKISVRDLESNVSHSKEITLDKTVERRSDRDREVIGRRTNSGGQTVYIVRATEDEIMIKEAALSSKVIRNNGIRVVPTHIIDEALAEVDRVLREKAKDDPEKERRDILDGFTKRGVMPSAIEAFMGSPAAQFTPSDLVKLREILSTIEEGTATWKDFLEGTIAEEQQNMADASQPDTKGVEVREKLAAVAKDRGVEVAKTQAQTASQEELKADPKPAEPQQQAATESPLLAAITKAEEILKGTKEGLKKYQTILGAMKVRLSGAQKVIDAIPHDQHNFYLQQLSRAVDSLAEKGQK